MNAPESLPPELPSFDNSFAALPPAFYTRLNPTPLPAPYVVGVSDQVAELLGLPAGFVASRQFADIFAGNALLPGSEPLAAVYSSHQFGVWAGQLGDGRAHLLGGLRNAHGHWEIQLKGAGRTPYSRGADGRAVLRSSIREFLCSEAMAGLGVPTTRALCVIGADLPVRRETIETAAVVTRIAPSFVRFGSFEHWASRDRDAEVRQLITERTTLPWGAHRILPMVRAPETRPRRITSPDTAAAACSTARASRARRALATA